MAIFDLVTGVIGTVVLLLIAKAKHYPDLPATPFVVAGVLLTLPIAIFVHILFGVNTSLNYRLGLSKAPTRQEDA